MKCDYYIAPTIENVIAKQRAHPGKSAVIAGGTDIFLDIEEGKKSADLLIDVTQIPELNQIEETGGRIRIGAAVTHAAVEKSSVIQRNAHLLAEACRSVGSLQIRNIATLAGNIVSAQPAADAAVALTALDAEIEIAGQDGRTTIPILKAYKGVGKSAIDTSSQLVTAITFDALNKNQGSAFIRLEQRTALALPMLNVAAVAALNPDGKTFAWVRIVMAPVGAGPVRALKAEKSLKDAPATMDVITAAAELAATEANPRSSRLRGSREYRMEVLPVLVRRAVAAAVEEVPGHCLCLEKEAVLL